MFDEFDRQILSAGEVLFKTGDIGDCAYLVESGQIEIIVQSEQDELRLGLIEKGELFGEVALLDQQPRTASARALERTVLIPIQHRIVENLLEKSDPILRHLLLVILERFRGKHTPLLPLSSTTELSERNRLRDAIRGEATLNIALTHDITRAITHNEFELHYQPICRLTDGKISGFEALIRWQHPLHGLIPPLDFLWLAEQTGLIVELGLWTLDRACRDWHHLRQKIKTGHPFISVNLSPSQLTSENLSGVIRSIVTQYSVPPSELKLELTETVVIERPELAMSILRRLTELGNTLSLDDYGTGYSSLEYLQKYPFATLKIDRSFISVMHQSTQSYEIVRSTIKLAQTLGLQVVAEGVETETTKNMLLELGCDFGQGWLFGKPLPLTIPSK